MTTTSATLVAMDGEMLWYGAYSKNSGEGAVYVLRTTDGATYVEVAKLTASDAESGDQFGFSVAIDGHTIVVGTRGGEAAYIFHTSDDGATYIEIAKLTASGAAARTPSASPWRSTAALSWSRPPATTATGAQSTSSARATAAPRTARWPS